MSIKVMTKIWEESRAKGSARLVLLALADNADDRGLCWPSIQTLSNKTLLTTTTVRDIVKRLEKSGELARVERPGKSTLYTIVTPPAEHTPQENVGGTFHDTDPSQTTAPTPPADWEYTPPVSQETNHKEPSLEPSLKPSYAFDDFWAVYPRKAGKPKAREAFAKMINETPAETIIMGAIRYRDDPNRVDQYTKHPTTWLNADGWDDDPEPERNNAQTPTQRALDLLTLGSELQAAEEQRAISA